MRHIFCTVLLLLGGLSLAAQPLGGQSNLEQLELAADSARSNHNWYVALENYEKLFDETDEDIYRPIIALMNFRLRDVAATTRGYKNVFRRIEGADTTFNEHRFYYGQALKMAGDYDEARTYLEQFLQHNQDDRMTRLAQMELEGIGGCTARFT